mmetsp:Transcript_28722/g.69142  ORF Transcript_28722/g.69142 Transcript_28722/m.69142 type:complete len:112 (+) Transcript_28722:1054-1389(+)
MFGVPNLATGTLERWKESLPVPMEPSILSTILFEPIFCLKVETAVAVRFPSHVNQKQIMLNVHREIPRFHCGITMKSCHQKRYNGSYHLSIIDSQKREEQKMMERTRDRVQ